MISEREVFRIAKIAFSKDCRIFNNYLYVTIGRQINININHVFLLVSPFSMRTHEKISPKKNIVKIGIPWSSIN